MSRRLRQQQSQPVPAPLSRRQKKLAAPPPAKPVARRALTVGTGSIVSVLVLILLLAGWGTGMTLMMIFGDSLSLKLIAQNSEMQDAYEQRLQAFRAEIARLSLEMEQSRFDQTTVEGRVLELGRRQRQIESRLVLLNKLSELVAPGALSGGGAPALQPAAGSTPGRGNAPPAKGAPAGPPPISTPPQPTNRSSLDGIDPRLSDELPVQVAQLGAPPVVDPTIVEPQPSSEVDIFIERMDLALKRAEQRQVAILNTMIRLSESRVERLRGALQEIGMSTEVAMQQQDKARADVRIPNIVLSVSEQTGPFAPYVERMRQNFGLVHRMRHLVESLPITELTPSEIRYSSPFGFRKHPISGVQKLHGGIDMAAPIGTPIHAAGSGVVLSAGWGGGYGNLIQIDHGNGILTRYAHLSQMNVAAGQPVSAGALIGLMGTTGASTGSHLHFETRIHNAPVNPACFMLAGERIAGRQTVPLICDKPPTWQKNIRDEEEDDDS